MPGVLGLHLEGPCLNPRRGGAHDAGKFRKIDQEGIEILTSLVGGAVTLVTLAPEMTSPEVIERLCSAGVIVFAGHSEANYEQCRRAVASGLSGFTHLFNAMPPMTSRAPGMVGAALDLDDPVFSIIADGHHVHPASLRVALGANKRGKAVLVTDAMPTVGSTLTEFQLGGDKVTLKDGVLRNRRGSLAGSHLNMLEAVRNIMELTSLDWPEALRMASSYPARAIGVADRRGYILTRLPRRSAGTRRGYDPPSNLDCRHPRQSQVGDRVRRNRLRISPGVQKRYSRQSFFAITLSNAWRFSTFTACSAR